MNALKAYAEATLEIFDKFGYVYGANGEILTEKLLEILEKNNPSKTDYYDTARVRQWLGYHVADCSGYIVYLLRKLGVYENDANANDLLAMCDAHVKPRTGYLAFRLDGTRAVHVGVCTDEEHVIQARGTDYGVVETNSEYKWDLYGELILDIEDVHWAEPYFQFLQENGIMYSDRRFNDTMTRGEYFAAKAKELGV